MLPSHCFDLSFMILFTFDLCRIQQFQMCTLSMHTMLLLLLMLQVDFTLHQQVREALVSKVKLSQYLLNAVFCGAFCHMFRIGFIKTSQGKCNPQFNKYQVETDWLLWCMQSTLFSLALSCAWSMLLWVCSCRLAAL